MVVPNTKISQAEWFGLEPSERKSKLAEVLTFLVAIEKKKLRIQSTGRGGELGPIRKRLENFVENVIIWEIQINPEK